ncbi:hypothetical protein KQH61_05550 [bacterium]|nr:hypothetical protein [bacterium]MCB2179367.1 hypothetical protein [bacterium]
MRIQFATLAIPPGWMQETVLLVESLRAFGGDLSTAPVSVWSLPDRPPTDEAIEKLTSLDATLHTFEMEAAARKFPLAVIPFGAAAAEAFHQNDADILVWLLPDTLILQPPAAFQLSSDIQLAYRPVHHQNIGSPIKEAADAFWEQIYRHCEVPPERLFPMQTCYREVVRPYFNAGILALHPDDGLCQTWMETFRRTYQHADFTPFFEQPRYAIFMHQAILSGVILQRFDQTQLVELPENYNYPLHMHTDYPQVGKPASLEAIATARYESVGELGGFLETIPASPVLREWFSSRNPLL